MSRIYVYTAIAIILGTHFLYYPKWQKNNTEATISWDVSGYYLYLPAIFIYNDLKKCEFLDDVLEKYNPTPEVQQGYRHATSGNFVIKYSIGQALVYSPYFFIGHVWAKLSTEYPADGFSLPYQISISMGALLISVIGLLILYSVLKIYFSKKISGLAVLVLVIGSNYLNYAAIDGAMTHNTLFTLYAALILLTVRFYENPTSLRGMGIGVLVALCTLVRPTDLISLAIPLLWGIDIFKNGAPGRRLSFFKKNYKSILPAMIICILIGSIQFIYWYYVTGEWVVYSYQDQGFSWLNPHIKNGLISYKSGWLTYSPFMIFSILGFYFLYIKHKQLFVATLFFVASYIYISFAWDIWWYGGSLGQRTMVQSYPILAFPLAAFLNQFFHWNRSIQLIVGTVAAIFIYMNLWFTHQAHLGGMLHVGQMTKAYYWATLLTYNKEKEHLKLLDGVDKVYMGERKRIRTIYQDTSFHVELDQEVQYSEEKMMSLNVDPNKDWMRVSAEFTIGPKERNFWYMTQFRIRIYNHDEVINEYMIRPQRHMNDHQTKRLFTDVPVPQTPWNKLSVKFTNAEGDKWIKIEHLKIEAFDVP